WTVGIEYVEIAGHARIKGISDFSFYCEKPIHTRGKRPKVVTYRGGIIGVAAAIEPETRGISRSLDSWGNTSRIKSSGSTIFQQKDFEQSAVRLVEREGHRDGTSICLNRR